MATTLPSWPERLSSNKQRVIQGLVHGQDCANQLQVLFLKSSQDEQGSERLSAEQLVLVQEILRSFNDTISVLSSTDSAEVVSQNQAASNDDSPNCCDDRRSEDSSESRKTPAASKDKRGCYKRKRTAQTWVVVSSTMEDGHAWRKYGQKDILNSKHPRSYFRCTRKFDQGCKATKQVQKMEDDSQMFQTTYIGSHTCKDSLSLKAPQMITVDSESWKEPYVPTASSGDSKQQQHHQSSTAPTIKQESKEETATPSDLTDLDSMNMWKDLVGEPDYGDVVSNMYSCPEITSRSTFGMEFSIKAVPVEFGDDDFHFEECY